ncbi:MAG: ATP-binding protein [Burkholderiales bacterium]
MARPSERAVQSVTTPPGSTRSAFARLRARLVERPDSEHEQALVRLANALLLAAYLFPEMNRNPALWLGFVTYFVAGAAVVAAILLRPEVSPMRRVLGAALDASTITWTLMYFGEAGAPLYLIYLWITLANGFRYGARYLLVTLAFCATGFGFDLVVSNYWSQHRTLGVGLLVGLIVLSLYVKTLVTRLFDAIARAEQANQAKRRFISVVSHEMRTPLNAIVGMTDLLRESPLNREQADMLQTLRGSSRILLGLIDDVLDFSKIEAGKLVLEKTDFDLHALVNSTCRIVATQASAKGLEFVVSIMPEVPPAVCGDPHYLRQVLINLAGNAVKFTERGTVTVHVSAHGETGDKVQLKFSIRDTGIGIAPEAQSRVFESFAQADQGTTRRFGGTGLGTTIAKQLVELMGGRIGFESAVGLGSTFWFELALDKQPERAGAARELAGAHVLLVGFPALEGSSIDEALGGWGAVPVHAKSAAEAAARLVPELSTGRPYHSVLIYAATNDFELAADLRRREAGATPPCVLAVPRALSVPRFEALSAGFAAVLELPFDKRRLFNVLHSIAAGEEAPEGVVRLTDYARRGQDARTLRILVADDNPTNREVISKILDRGGHVVKLVEDGEKTLDAIESDRYDLVILDRNMPGLSGVQALQALRLMGRGEARVPVLMLSADATAEAKKEAYDAGANAFLPKPIEALRLLEEVQELTGARAPIATLSAPARIRAPRDAASPTDAPLVNAETLAYLEELGSSAAFVRKLCGVFVADSTALLERIEAAIAARNYDDFRSQVHALKGSSASIGTERLTRLCGRLGAYSNGELRLQGATVVQTLAAELSATRSALDRYLQQKHQSAT